MQKRKTILIRTYLVYFFCLAFAIAILVQLIKIQYVERDEWLDKAKNATIRWRNIEAPRGSIISSDGKLLATSVPITNVRMDLGEQKDRTTGEMKKVVHPDTLSKYINALSDSLVQMSHRSSKYKTAGDFKKAILSAYAKKNRYFLVLSNLTYPELMRVKNFPLFKKGLRGGMVLEEFERREKPFSNLAMRTIGKFDLEKKEFTGLEEYYFPTLEGKSGKRQEEKISGNNWRPVSNQDIVEPERGKDIVTTLDMRLQDVAENSLRKCLDSNMADYGCAILMEVGTGYIRAITNLKRSAGGGYYEDFNYAIWDASEPGSTFKLATTMAILENGKMDSNSMVATGKKSFGNYTMEDSHVKYEIVTLNKAFEQSSNVGIAIAADSTFKKKPKDFVKFLEDLSLGKPLGLELSGERTSVIKNKDSNFVWAASLPLMSIGYGIKVTPLQTLTLYNAVANNGKMVKPLFVKEIRDGGQVISTMPPVVINKSICSNSTIGKLRTMMEGVVQNGTARSLRTSPYPVAGKTGTAQINYIDKGKEKMRYRASFVGYFPADNPKYSCIVVIVDPQKGKFYGGELAAPVFKEIADKVYALDYSLQQNKQLAVNDTVIPFVRAGNADAIHNLYSYLSFPFANESERSKWIAFMPETKSYKSFDERKNMVPNVYGMTCKDAVPLLENMGLKVIVKGRGKVVNTEPSNGAGFIKGQTIVLNLEI